MRQRTEFGLLMLQQIGLPLLRSLASAADATQDAAKESSALADLLRRSTEYGAHIEKSLDLNPGEEKNKPLRIALTALGAQTLALYREQNGKLPGDNEAKRIFSALEPVLTFADRFVPEEQSISRLRGLSADFALLDGQQLQLQQIMAFLPVLQAVAAFSFGQSETKLVKEIGERLSAWSSAFRERLFGAALDPAESKIVDLIFLKMLAALYADCHAAQTARLTKKEQVENGENGMKAVWAAYELRASMLETLAGTFLPSARKEQPVAEISWDKTDPLPPADPEENGSEQAGEAKTASA